MAILSLQLSTYNERLRLSTVVTCLTVWLPFRSMSGRKVGPPKCGERPNRAARPVTSGRGYSQEHALNGVATDHEHQILHVAQDHAELHLHGVAIETRGTLLCIGDLSVRRHLSVYLFLYPLVRLS